MTRTGRPANTANRDAILAMAAQGMEPKDIIRAGFKRSTVYHLLADQRDASQVTVPATGAQAIDIRDSMTKVSVGLSHEQFARMGTNPTVVAGMMVAEKEKSESLKQRLLDAIAQEGPWDDVLTLMRHIRRPGDPRDTFGSHEVTHIIKSMGKQGIVTYVESRDGSVVIPKRISITKQGARMVGLGAMPKQLESTSIVKTGGRRHPPGWSRARHAPGIDRTEARNHGNVAQGGEILRISAAEQVPMSQPLDTTHRGAPEPEERPQAPEPVAPATGLDLSQYPLLQSLLGRFAENAANDAKAAAYADAAAALEAIDPKRSEELMALALAAGGKPFTPIEIEMLRLLESLTN